MLLRRISVALLKNWYYWGSTADVIFIVGVKKKKNYKLCLCTVYFDK